MEQDSLDSNLSSKTRNANDDRDEGDNDDDIFQG